MSSKMPCPRLDRKVSCPVSSTSRQTGEDGFFRSLENRNTNMREHHLLCLCSHDFDGPIQRRPGHLENAWNHVVVGELVDRPSGADSAVQYPDPVGNITVAAQSQVPGVAYPESFTRECEAGQKFQSWIEVHQ